MSFVYKYQTVDSTGRYAWAMKSFRSQSALFHYLVENKELILSQKKSITKRAEGTISATYHTEITKELFVDKAKKPVYENDKEAGLLKRTILANTYWWMDSHSDVHLGRGDDPNGKAVFTNTIKGRENKVYPIDQHDFSLDGRMGKTIELYEAPISWRNLGIGRTGMTEGLFAVAEISKAKNASRYEDYLNDEIDQHSVGMRYIDIQLAVNDEEEFPKEAAVYKKYINKIGNKSAVDKQGYFFAVGEAFLAEYSAVIAGSNELTPTIGQASGEAGKSLSSGEAVSNKVLEALKQLNKTIKH